VNNHERFFSQTVTEVHNSTSGQTEQ